MAKCIVVLFSERAFLVIDHFYNPVDGINVVILITMRKSCYQLCSTFWFGLFQKPNKPRSLTTAIASIIISFAEISLD